MAFDAHGRLSYSTVATAPSPATSGTSLVVSAGTGTTFPTPPFNCTVWPTGANPTTSNSEIVRVTGVSTDTFTITRAQEGSSARTVVIGDQIANTATVKTFTDIETVLVAGPSSATNTAIPVFDGTTGKLVKNTGVIIDGSNNIFTGFLTLSASGSITLGTAGAKLNITTGSNASAGTGTLSSGTATISTTAVTASSLIFLQDTAATLTNVGILSVSAKSAGVSFTVTSANVLDTSTFNWMIVN